MIIYSILRNNHPTGRKLLERVSDHVQSWQGRLLLTTNFHVVPPHRPHHHSSPSGRLRLFILSLGRELARHHHHNYCRHYFAMLIHSKGTTKGRHNAVVHVGTPSLYFHGFADLPEARGKYVQSLDFSVWAMIGICNFSRVGRIRKVQEKR
jgi:hypothetical protein